MSDTNSGFVTTEVTDSNALSRASRLLAAFPGGVQKAANSALKRAATAGRTGAAREVNKLYHLKTADFTKYTRSKQSIQTAGDEISVSVEFRGSHIPLIRFNSRATSSGRVSVQVKRDSTAKTLDRVFRSVMDSSHIGLFERVVRSRLPIEEKFGPSVPQMMGANPELSKNVGEKMSKTFEERMEHEILAIMNGWR